MRVWFLVIAIAISVWAIVEIVQSEARDVRRLPKWLWGVTVGLTFFTALGAIAWFFLGRPKVAVNTPGQTGAAPAGPTLGRRQRYVSRPAPDDDPEFLRKLNSEAEHQRMLRRMEDDLNSPGDENGGGPQRD